MFYASMGVDLEVDLTRGNIERFEGDPQLYETYLGGRSIGTKMFWDRVPPELDPRSPDNPLIFNAGLLVGTICPGANRTIVTTRSPQTFLQTYSSFGGFFAAELKFAGYDSLVVTGQSDTPVYLLILDDRIEIRDARHLWGKDTFATQELIKRELDNDDVQIICIGPAGENEVMAASIEHCNGASASRAGIGAVMGRKKLKAIAVKGTKDVKIARPEPFYELTEKLLLRSAKQRQWVDDIGRNQLAGLVRLSLYGNMEPDLVLPEAGERAHDFLEKNRARRPSCFNCQIGCRQAVHLPGTSYGYLKCVSHYTFWSAFKIENFEFNFRCYHLLEKMGMDTVSVCNLGPLAIDLYQKGIITKEDTGGLHLEYGNEEIALTLIEQIARRQGIGAILADGIHEAVQKIGRGAEQHAHYTKKIEQCGFPFQFPYVGFVAAVADRPDITRQISFVPQHLALKPPEFKQEYVNSEFWPYPKEWRKYGLEPFDPTGGDWERMSKMISHDRDAINLADVTGICTFWTDFWAFSPINPAEQAELISYATGKDIDERQAITSSARSGALIRAYNNIVGLRRKDDAPPEMFFNVPARPRFQALDRDKFNKFLDEYYKLRGWNESGVPTRDTLHDLGLDFVARELERRGIYEEDTVGVRGGVSQ